jgi:DNA-binding transcriptional regulator YbjK
MRILQRIKYYFKYIFQVITEPINHLTQEEVENEIAYFENISNLNEETEDMIIWYERLKKQKK